MCAGVNISHLINFYFPALHHRPFEDIKSLYKIQLHWNQYHNDGMVNHLSFMVDLHSPHCGLFALDVPKSETGDVTFIPDIGHLCGNLAAYPICVLLAIRLS